MRLAKRLTPVVLLILGAGLLAAPGAGAVITTPFGPTGPACTPDAGDRVCTGIVTSFDGAKIDVKLRLPGNPLVGSEGPYPLVMGFHGWGGSKNEYNLDRWVNKGYAAFTMSDRGWGSSCGGQDPDRLLPACGFPTGPKGYNHLMDTRFEVRDAQVMAGKLVDNGVAIADKIGATGPSYGGGISMALAALKNRVMMPDGSLVPWQSPNGTPMEIAAAAPEIPWTDLAYSLVPNGSTLDYAVDSTYDKREIGVMKQSFVSGLYGIGVATSNFAPVGTDPSADVNGWFARLNAGDPYDGDPTAQGIVDEVTEFHSSYYIDHSTPPSPLLISNGFTDDLFPVDEAVRFYNRTRDQYPGAHISMMHFDWGHQRGQNKAADGAVLDAKQEAFFDYYLKGTGSQPADDVTTIEQTCPSGASSGSPHVAATWAALAPGEVRFQKADQQVIAPEAGSPVVSQAFDPITGPGACATGEATDQPGVANYRLDPAPAGGYTLMGSPTIVADILSPGLNDQLVGRLVDVDPATGNETLVARGVYRPDMGTAASRQVFQLHPNGYKFAAGHVAKLELLPSDTPYARKTNGQLPITVAGLDLRLPVLESPGSPAAVTAPAPKFVPDGYELSSDYGSDGDSDGDGVPNSVDACDDDPGPASNNGCPLPDDDDDGVPNASDDCPNQAGPASNNGCPENAQDDDADGDGVLNSKDACPNVAGPAANAGCPYPDDPDNDGVRGDDDKCPQVAAPGTPDGCPANPVPAPPGRAPAPPGRRGPRRAIVCAAPRPPTGSTAAAVATGSRGRAGTIACPAARAVTASRAAAERTRSPAAGEPTGSHLTTAPATRSIAAAAAIA